MVIAMARMGQRSIYNTYGCGDAVTRSVLPRSAIEDSFSSYF